MSQLFFIRGVELIGPNRAGIFVNLIPILGMGLAILILREALEACGRWGWWWRGFGWRSGGWGHPDCLVVFVLAAGRCSRKVRNVSWSPFRKALGPS
jgi:hypothetical protein